MKKTPTKLAVTTATIRTLVSTALEQAGGAGVNPKPSDKGCSTRISCASG